MAREWRAAQASERSTRDAGTGSVGGTDGRHCQALNRATPFPETGTAEAAALWAVLMGLDLIPCEYQRNAGSHGRLKLLLCFWLSNNIKF